MLSLTLSLPLYCAPSLYVPLPRHTLLTRHRNRYLANLPSSTSEPDLLAVFERCPGFKRLNFQASRDDVEDSGATCHVEFENVDAAGKAMDMLFGSEVGLVGNVNGVGLGSPTSSSSGSISLKPSTSQQDLAFNNGSDDFLGFGLGWLGKLVEN